MNEQKKFFKLMQSQGIRLLIEGTVVGILMAVVFTFKWLF